MPEKATSSGPRPKLTYDFKVHLMSARWRCGYLTLIFSGIIVRQFSNSQLPKMCHGNVVRRKALIWSVSISANCQQMNVSVTHPRYLKIELELRNKERFIGVLTVLFPRCSTWHANRTSLPKTPVTLGESSGLINGPVLIWLSESSVFKAEKKYLKR